MSKKKVLRSTIITMLAIAFAILPALFSHTDKTVMAAVKKCETTSSSAVTTEPASGSAITAEKQILRLNYRNFIIRSSNGKYAKVQNEKVVEGDFEVSYFDILDFNEDPMFGYYINGISDGEQYTIEPLDLTKNSYQTSFGRYDDKNNWSIRVEADKPVKITINSDGTGKTETLDGEKAQQCIYTGDISLTWYATSISGQSTGFGLSKKEQSHIISSSSDTNIDIVFHNVIGNSEVDNVTLTNEPIVITNDGYAYIISDLDGNVLARKEMWIYVYYISDVEKNTVAATSNLTWKSMAIEPEHVTREGYELEGWYTTPTYEEGTKWEFFKDYVTEDTYLYAKWVKKETTKQVTVSKVTKVTAKNKASKKASITWKKVSNATGYEVQYSTSKTFAKSKTKTVTTKTNKVTLKILKKNKKYYIRVRAYVKNGKTVTYGTYSKVCSVKVKK